MTASTRFDEIHRIFDAAVELPAAERTALLTKECGVDGELRTAVENLLSSHDRAGQFLTGATISIDVAAFDDSPKPGTRIAAYTLVRKLGQGGFGSVFLAEQDRPLKRLVALKVVKPGMDTRQVIDRFDVERQSLAMMNHPNICRVLDAGTTDAGQPYFVMEYVEGRPISEFCLANSLSVRDQLNLFLAVCSAVQHAHDRGILHRDLKPANVLVAIESGQPTPKIIDFGIAKALSPQAAADIRSDITVGMQLLGTPEYMSPEQAGGSEAAVDHRSDIYSLGALLYEILTGVPPLDAARLHQASFAEIHRILHEVIPTKPSERVRAVRKNDIEAAAKIAAGRVQELSGPIDQIVMKALEKDPANRYGSVVALAADVRRYLDDEVVFANPVSDGGAGKSRRWPVRFLIAGGVIGAVLLAVVLVALFVRRWHEKHGENGVASDQAPGLAARVYEGIHFRRHASQHTDRQIHAAWLAGDGPASGANRTNYGIRWTGKLLIPITGKWSIGLDADDGARLYIDGRLISRIRSERVLVPEELSAGQHNLRIDYWNERGPGHITLLWVPPNGKEQIIPPEFLTHSTTPTPGENFDEPDDTDGTNSN
jgi:serine/threonine protein kinase